VSDPIPSLELREITKTYGSVRALRSADLTVYPNEVVGLVGDNGAGKSTLVKTMSGALTPDSGTILMDGEPITLGTPRAARAHGIETVYQDLALAPDLDPSANLYLGREIVRGGLLGRLGVLDKPKMRRGADEAFARLGVGIQDTSSKVATMSGGQRQGVAVGRAVVWASRVVLMDEPTAALGVQETARVEDTIVRMRERGKAILIVSHSLDQVFRLADRICVLRRGRQVGVRTTAETDGDEIVAMITGLR
jgi:simple sugar transport system ATP-binding protein